jgi:site-specific recombinase XerC
MTLRLYRRHSPSCKHYGKKRPRSYDNCDCIFWADGILDGKRYHKTLKTNRRDKANRKIEALESKGESGLAKPIAEALNAWEDYQITQGLRRPTLRKYGRVIRALSTWCEDNDYLNVQQLTVPVLDRFRASRAQIHIGEKESRPRAANTTVKELEILRAFFGFCADRDWCATNPAKKIKTPKIPANQVVPYTREGIAAILAACDQIGQSAYERLRARAVILLMRYSGLRISDALTLRKDQVHDGTLTLLTKKTGGQIVLPIPGELVRALECLPLPIGAERDTAIFSGMARWTRSRWSRASRRL